MSKKALVIVDVQNDFCPGGSLAVKDGDRVVPALNKYIKAFDGLPIYVSRDWHPPKTTHFKEFGGKWPPHCVQGTTGAKFHPDLELPEEVVIISKGVNPKRESYSAFQGTDGDGRPFAEVLKEEGVEDLYVGGLATDYCVKATCLDGRKAGFNVFLLKDAVRGVDLKRGDSKKAIQEMLKAGVEEVSYR